MNVNPGETTRVSGEIPEVHDKVPDKVSGNLFGRRCTSGAVDDNTLKKTIAYVKKPFNFLANTLGAKVAAAKAEAKAKDDEAFAKANQFVHRFRSGRGGSPDFEKAKKKYKADMANSAYYNVEKVVKMGKEVFQLKIEEVHAQSHGGGIRTKVLTRAEVLKMAKMEDEEVVRDAENAKAEADKSAPQLMEHKGEICSTTGTQAQVKRFMEGLDGHFEKECKNLQRRYKDVKGIVVKKPALAVRNSTSQHGQSRVSLKLEDLVLFQALRSTTLVGRKSDILSVKLLENGSLFVKSQRNDSSEIDEATFSPDSYKYTQLVQEALNGINRAMREAQ